MRLTGTWRWLAGLAVGIVLGLAMASFWPSTPLHALSTDRAESIVITTGPIDDGIEALFYLDSLTGTLRGAVPSRRGAWQAYWERNVNVDLANYIKTSNAAIQAAGHKKGGARPEIQLPQSPKYMMTTGLVDVYGTVNARLRPGRSVLYVAEANTGVVMAYMIPWSASLHSSGQAYNGVLEPFAVAPFTSAVIRAEE